MSRPKSKSELAEVSEKNYRRLLELIDSFTEPEQQKEFPSGYLNRNIKDVVAHLHHWHLMMLDWYAEGMQGNKPEMPAKGYTWKTLPELNKEIQKMYQHLSLNEARKLLGASFLKLQQIIQNHTDEELFEKKRYFWTGTTSLGAYLISATSSHYDWACKLIKKCLISGKNL